MVLYTYVHDWARKGRRRQNHRFGSVILAYSCNSNELIMSVPNHIIHIIVCRKFSAIFSFRFFSFFHLANKPLLKLNPHFAQLYSSYSVCTLRTNTYSRSCGRARTHMHTLNLRTKREKWNGNKEKRFYLIWMRFARLHFNAFCNMETILPSVLCMCEQWALVPSNSGTPLPQKLEMRRTNAPRIILLFLRVCVCISNEKEKSLCPQYFNNSV